MKAREFAERHMLREARVAIAREGYFTGAALSKALSAVVVTPEQIEQTIRTSRKKAEFCAFVTQRFAGEEWPEGILDELGQRGAWKRELAEMARSEGLTVE
jgi:hypothetical protein